MVSCGWSGIQAKLSPNIFKRPRLIGSSVSIPTAKSKKSFFILLIYQICVKDISGLFDLEFLPTVTHQNPGFAGSCSVISIYSRSAKKLSQNKNTQRNKIVMSFRDFARFIYALIPGIDFKLCSANFVTQLRICKNRARVIFYRSGFRFRITKPDSSKLWSMLIKKGFIV